MSNSLVPPLFPEQSDFSYVWRESAKYNAAEERKVQSLSSVMDADEALIRKNLPEYESLFAARQLYNDTVARTYPTLYRNLTSVPFVAVARDDMGNVIETEGWWNEIANAYNVARDTVAIGNIGTRAMLDGRDLYPYERRKIERARQRQRAHMQSEPGFLAAAAELAGTMQETLGYSLAAGYTAGAISGPAAPVVGPIAAGIAGFATSFNLEAGNLYADLIMDGYTPAQATEIGASYGALIAGFEAVGLKFAGKPIKELGKELFKKQGRDLLRRETAGQITGRIFADYAKGILAESTTEGVQEILSELGKARASQIYRPENLYEPEYYETFQQAFVHTAKGMVVLGGVPSAVRLANDSIKSANANYDFEKAREAAEIRSRSQAPEAQSQIDAEAAEADSYNSSYYIRAQDFLTGIRAQGEAQGFTEQQVRETVEANSPGLMSRIDEAAERDGDVELTKADWDKAFHDTKFRETTLQHTAFEEDGLTKREADENEAIREKMMQDASEEAKQALQDQETFEQELREVRRDLRNQLDVALEGMDAAQTMTAAANSAVLSGFIRRNALAMGIGPKEFVEKHLPQIVQQRLTGQQRGEGFQAGVEGQVFSPDPNKFYRGFQEVSELDRLRHMMKGEFYPDSFVIEMDEDTEAYDVGGDGVSDKPGAFRGYVRPEKVSRIFVDVDAYSTYPTETVGELREMFPNAEIVNVRLVERTGQPDLFVAAEPGPRPDTLESGTFDQDADYTFTESDYRPEVVAWAKERFGDRVAPNGKPVYQNFVRWFGDSKVVDAEGKPLVVYHGTKDIFDQFKGRRFEDQLIFFSPNPEMAAQWPRNRQREFGGESTEEQARRNIREERDQALQDAAASVGMSTGEFIDAYPSKRGPQQPAEVVQAWDAYLEKDNQIRRERGDPSDVDRMVYPVYLSAQNVFDPRTMWQDILPFLKTIPVLSEVTSNTRDDAYYKSGNWLVYERADVVAELKRRGFDAMMLAEEIGGPHETIAVFDPNQIKSTQNQGDFSADPGILYSKEGGEPRPNVIRAYHGTAGRFEDFNKAVRDALAKWDVVRKKLQADIDKAKAEHEKSREAERKLREETNQQLESDLAKLEQERKALEDDGSQSFYEKRKQIFRRRDRLKSEAYQTVRNSPQTKALRKTLKSLEEAQEAYQEAKSQTSPPDRYLRRRDIVKTPRTKVDRKTGEKSVVYDTKEEGPFVVNEEMLSDFFNEKHIGSTDYGYGPRGIYFTEDQGQAKEYSQPAFSGRDRIPGYKPKPYVYTVDIDTSQFYDYRNPVAEIEEAINEKFDSEFKQLLRQRGGPETFEAGVARAKREVLEAAGYKGMIFRMKDSAGSPGFSKTGEEIVVFDTSVIQEVSSPDGVLFSRTGEGDQKRKTLGTASFEGTDAIQKILLDPDAKPTTLMHELMHWNLELMATIGLDIETKVAQAGYEATVQEAQMLGDIQRLLKWSGFEGTLTEWRAMTTDQRREFHEVIAMSFETYLYEGVAPSRELRGVFSRLADYIRGAFEELVLGYQETYNAIRKQQGKPEQPLPSLNDDVRAIFGRMMSAERDVEMFLTENDLDAMMVTKKEWTDSGRDADEYDEYEREFKDAIYEAKAELTQRRMKEVAYQQNARRRIGKDLDRELREATKQIRTEEELAARLTAVQQVREWIKTGKYLTEEGEYTPLLSGNRKLDRDAIAAIDPELAKSMPRSLLKRGGLPLEVARQQFGFESVEQMLQALAESRSLKEEVDARTDQRVLDELTDLTDPIVVEEKIQSAIHNKIRHRIVALELKYLLNNGRSSRLEMRLATDIALRIIETTPTGDINLRSYSAAASRARKKALKALKDGDMEAAAFAKRQELVNEALIREGGKAREEVRKLVRMNQRVFKRRTDKAIAEAGYDVVVVKALRALLNRLGIGTLDGDPAEMLARFQQEDPGFFGEVRPQIEYFLKMDLAQPRVGDRRKPMEHLTVGDVRSLRGLAKRMMKRAKDKRSATIGERKANIDTLRQEAQDTLESNVEVTREPDDKSIFGKIRDYLSDITRFEHLFRRADGGKVGIWTQMFRQVKDAANKYRQELRQFLSGDGFDFEGKLRSLDLKIPGGVRTLTMDLPAAGRKVEIGKNGRHAKTELIHLAMHYYGNSSNRKRLVEGYAGRDATEDTMQQVDVEIRRFLEQQIQQGILTRKDFEFMQSVFDHFSGADMLGRAQKVMKNLRGYEMTEVKGEKFLIQFPDGEQEFGGGYIPVRFKETVQKEDQGQGVLEEDASLEQQASRMVNILPGFTKDRVKGEVGLELHLGLSGLANHAAEVYRFINMAEPIDSVSRVLNGRDLAAAFKARFGNKAYTNLEGWLKRSAFQRFDRGEQSEVGSMLLRMSRNANMSVMFLNIGNTLQNYAGLLIPMRRVGKRRLISSLIHSAFNKKLAAEVASKSKEMKARLERQIFDIYNSQTRILTSEDSAWARLQSWSDKYAYVLQQITQNHVDVAVWQAAYNQETEAALKEGMSAGDAEARAVAHADSIVRQSQMAGEKEDISAFEAGGSISRALFPFKSWFINWFNNAATQRRLDLKVEDRSRVAAVASTYLYMLMIPAVLAQAAVELARGEDWDDDDDGYGDDMLELFARSQFEQVVGGLPVVSDISRLAANNWFDNEYWNNRYPVAPWVRALERIVTAPVRKDAVDAGLDMATQAANLMGVPAVGVWNRVNLIGDEIAGELESESTYDLIRGAVTGQRSDLQRLSQ